MEGRVFIEEADYLTTLLVDVQKQFFQCFTQINHKTTLVPANHLYHVQTSNLSNVSFYNFHKCLKTTATFLEMLNCEERTCSRTFIGHSFGSTCGIKTKVLTKCLQPHSSHEHLSHVVLVRTTERAEYTRVAGSERRASGKMSARETWKIKHGFFSPIICFSLTNEMQLLFFISAPSWCAHYCLCISVDAHKNAGAHTHAQDVMCQRGCCRRICIFWLTKGISHFVLLQLWSNAQSH